ncbi:MAG: L-alanine-DL-glutamate epimerase [Kiritimatiellae bacterium]|nr:L-alanine-DL-glutamate epimerase [Kiritimatiellia bacterium]
MQRRDFIKMAGLSAAALGAGCATTGSTRAVDGAGRPLKRITIADASCQFEREPMVRPFGFKGGYLTEEWIVSAFVRSTSGKYGIGLGTQSCLWSDAAVFASNSEAGGNAIMFAMTQHALKLLKGKSFESPVELNDWLWPQVWAYGKKVANNPNLRATFALNALVSVDNALWVLFARENGMTSFDEMIPPAYRPALSCHHEKCASIPLMSYAVPVPEVRAAVDSGYFFMKIKIGQPGTQAEMLDKDMKRVSAIHAALKDARTPYTKTGKLPYYFDANGRYEKKETLLKFIDHLKAIGAYDQVAIIEEPFDEHADIDVNDIPLRLAADESAHTVKDALDRMDMGYRAMALKPIAKTMSMSMKIAQAAFERKVPCFCADLTVCPIMVEWNKAVAARLPAFPGLGDLGLVETNGHQNFRNWETMRKDLPYPSAHWSRTEKGVFECDKDWYAKSGGMLEHLPRYEEIFRVKKG